MKVRSVANGNILDESEVHSGLIDAGIYERIDETAEAAKPEAETTEATAPVEVAADEPAEETSTAVEPMTTENVAAIARKQPARRRGRA
jgi:hypothetical protein